MLRRCISAIILIVPASAAMAHPGGGHASLSLSELAQHYAEPDHLAFLAAALVIGVAAFGYGRRIEARARKATRNPDGGKR